MTARIPLIVLGVIGVLIGAVWVGQGLNYLPGSFMTGNKMWFWIGLAVGLLGLVLIGVGATRRRRAVAGDASRP